jgi:transcriptional regulator
VNEKFGAPGRDQLVMYSPDVFRVTDSEVVERFIATYSFAVLVSPTSEGLLATHVPFLLEREGGRDVLLGHMARGNPHWRQFDGDREAIVIFQGPHGYVSPSWYATSPAVPTWNYAVVHAYGRPSIVGDRSRVQSILAGLVARHESSMRAPWSSSDLPADYLGRMTDAVVGFAIQVDRFETKFKLGQNRSREDIDGLITGLMRNGSADGLALADFTREALTKKGA